MWVVGYLQKHCLQQVNIPPVSMLPNKMMLIASQRNRGRRNWLHCSPTWNLGFFNHSRWWSTVGCIPRDAPHVPSSMDLRTSFLDQWGHCRTQKRKDKCKDHTHMVTQLDNLTRLEACSMLQPHHEYRMARLIGCCIRVMTSGQKDTFVRIAIALLDCCWRRQIIDDDVIIKYSTIALPPGKGRRTDPSSCFRFSATTSNRPTS